MARTLWQLPVPSTALIGGGPVFEKRVRREVALRMAYETEAGEQAVAVVFEGVEAFKVTYDRARCDSMHEALDRLTDQGETSWLGEVSGSLRHHGVAATGLAHMRINFDDGPCYEVICTSYRLEPTPK